MDAGGRTASGTAVEEQLPEQRPDCRDAPERPTHSKVSKNKTGRSASCQAARLCGVINLSLSRDEHTFNMRGWRASLFKVEDAAYGVAIEPRYAAYNAASNLASRISVNKAGT